MAGKNGVTVICVDMGMTGTGVEWKNDKYGGNKWQPLSRKKIPTRLAYSEINGDQVVEKWGGETADLQVAKVRERFKSHLSPRSSFYDSKIPGTPSTRAEVHRWVYDYLKILCARIHAHLDEQLRGKGDWTEGVVHWNFSRPGSWGESTVLDFKRLAESAVRYSFTNSSNVHVRTDFSEANASAMAILVQGSLNRLYAVGNLIITCDIGGATTDIAVAHVNGPGTLGTLEQMAESPLGVEMIEKNFWNHVSMVLGSAGIAQAGDLALHLARSQRFIETCCGLGGTIGQHKVRFQLPPEYQSKSWTSSTHARNDATYIQGGVVIIHKTTWDSFFEEFTSQLEVAIDSIVNKLKPNFKPTVIGFCGGGSRFQIPMSRIRRRYQDVAVVNYTNLHILPEMATVKGSCLLWDQNEVRTFARNTNIGRKKGDRILWKDGQESLDPSTFEIPFRWRVSFACSKRSHERIVQIIAVPKLSGFPNTMEEALALPESRVWIVKADLKDEKSDVFMKRKCEVLCDIIGLGEFAVHAISLSSGKKIGKGHE